MKIIGNSIAHVQTPVSNGTQISKTANTNNNKPLSLNTNQSKTTSDYSVNITNNSLALAQPDDPATSVKKENAHTIVDVHTIEQIQEHKLTHPSPLDAAASYAVNQQAVTINRYV
ncbi:MAG: hypothetical protein HQL08_06215 [Nitrospirae bacterium]|nr:hypothetical protein [Nitrospirota bacterium]